MIVSVAEIKEVLNLSDDLGTADDALLAQILAAAQAHLERQLGFRIADRFGAAGQDPVPPDLVQAVSLLAAHWFENREGSLIGVSAQSLPFGIDEIVSSHREWSF